MTSAALRLTALSTVPSLLRSSGLLRRSATFCFSRERTFRLGSEAAGRRKGGSYDPPPPTLQSGTPPKSPAGSAPTGFTQREIVAAVVGAEQRHFVGRGGPGAAALGGGALLQGGVVSPGGVGMEGRGGGRRKGAGALGWLRAPGPTAPLRPTAHPAPPPAHPPPAVLLINGGPKGWGGVPGGGHIPARGVLRQGMVGGAGARLLGFAEQELLQLQLHLCAGDGTWGVGGWQGGSAWTPPPPPITCTSCTRRPQPQNHPPDLNNTQKPRWPQCHLRPPRPNTFPTAPPMLPDPHRPQPPFPSAPHWPQPPLHPPISPTASPSSHCTPNPH